MSENSLHKRREFVKNSAKVAGFAILASTLPLVAKAASSSANSAKNITNSNAASKSSAESSANSNANSTNSSVNSNSSGAKIAAAMPTVTLNNGVKMPITGFGTLRLGDAKTTQKLVEQALEAGYRLFDTAQSYANEEAVGAAFAATGVPRSELFITCKLFRP